MAVTPSRRPWPRRPRTLTFTAPTPPAEIRTAAIGLFARWIERYPSDGIVSVNHSDQSVSWAPIAMGSGVMLSGAAALLAPFRRPRGRVIEAALMISLNLTPPPRESRETTRTYKSDRLAQIAAASTSGPAAIATATACGRNVRRVIWGRALSLAIVLPQTDADPGDHTEPARAGRPCAGTARARSSSISRSTPAAPWRFCRARRSNVLIGSPDPATWIYALQCYGPSSTVTRYRPRDGVVHLQYGRDRDIAPGKGAPPGRPRSSPARSWQVSSGN